MGYQFGAIEIPVAVPAADQILATLAKIDERAQQVGQHAGQAFGGRTVPAFREAGAAAEGFEHRLSHLGVAGSFALGNLANGSEQGVTGLAHSMALFGGMFGAAGLVITTFVAVAGEHLLDWYRKSTEATDKATESLRKLRDEHRQGRFGEVHANVNRASEELADVNAKIAEVEKKIQEDFNAPVMNMAGGPGKYGQARPEHAKALADLQKQRTDLVSLINEGNAEIKKIQKDIDDEAAKRAKEARDRELADQKRLREAGDRLAEAGGAHLLKTHAFINEQKLKFDEASEADRLKAEEQFYRELEIEERDYYEKRRTARQVDLDHQREVSRQAEELAKGTADVIAGTVQGLFEGGLGGGFDAFTDRVEAMLGNLFVTIGEAMLAASPFLKAIAESLLNPASWLGGGIGLAAGGAALIVLGTALGAGAHHSIAAGGSSYGGGGGYGHAVVSTVRPSYMPNTAGVSAKQSIIVNASFFGKDDPKVQRELLETIARAQRRGTTAG